MPRRWPVAARPNGGGRMAEALTAMLSCPTGFDLILTLMSDPYWYDANARDAYKPAVDAAVAGQTAETPALFYAATILAKQIVRHVYDLTTGQLMVHRVATALNLARALAGAGPTATLQDAVALELPENDFEHYAGSTDAGAATIDAWQALKCLVALGAAKAMFDVKWGPTLDAVAAAAGDEDPPPFSSTLAYQTDLLSHLIRSSMALTGAVQQLSTRMLQCFDLNESLFRPTKMPMGGLQRDRGTDWDSAWRRYYFDLAAMWTMARVFHEALLSGDPKALVHAASNARTWTLAGALVDSVPNLEKALRKATAKRSGPLASALAMLPDILHAAATLHGLHLRIWDTTMVFCNTKRYGRGNIERAMARAAAAVLVAAPKSVSVRQESPECGGPNDPTAAVLMDNWPLSLLTPDQAGLVDPQSDTTLLGASLEDLKVACCTAHASRPVAQSVQHLWVCVTNPQAWVSLGDALPQMDDICAKLLTWRPDWSPTAEDLLEMGARLKQRAIAERAREQATELADLLKAF